MTSSYASILKEFFEKVKAGNISERGMGLCWHFNRFCISRKLSYHERVCAEEIFSRMLCNFPKYTGDPMYPLVLSDEYHGHLHTVFDFYDPATPYGAIRLEFVDWALKEIAQ